MSHAVNRVRQAPAQGDRFGPRVVRRTTATAARVAANEPSPDVAVGERRPEPMLLVYQERAETFRRILAALTRGYRTTFVR